MPVSFDHLFLQLDIKQQSDNNTVSISVSVQKPIENHLRINFSFSMYPRRLFLNLMLLSGLLSEFDFAVYFSWSYRFRKFVLVTLVNSVKTFLSFCYAGRLQLPMEALCVCLSPSSSRIRKTHRRLWVAYSHGVVMHVFRSCWKMRAFFFLVEFSWHLKSSTILFLQTHLNEGMHWKSTPEKNLIFKTHTDILTEMYDFVKCNSEVLEYIVLTLYSV